MKQPPHAYTSIGQGIVCWVAFICAFLLFCETSSAQAVRRRGITWTFPQAASVRLNGYVVKQVIETNGTRRAYIRRDKDRKWIPFYNHERFLLVTLGNRKQLVLINDCPATKFCKVMVTDLASCKSRQIDRSAIEMYRRNARPDGRLIIIQQ